MPTRYKSTKSKTYEGTETAVSKIATAENNARDFIAQAESVMARSNGPWIYGLYGPTVLDTHFVMFLRRLKDVGHYDFFTERTSRYLANAEKTKEFQDVMQGLDTVPGEMKQ